MRGGKEKGRDFGKLTLKGALPYSEAAPFGVATSYLIATEVELPEDPRFWQVKDIEKVILEKGRAAMREALVRMLRDQEKAILKDHPEWSRKELWPKKVATLFGDVKWERYRVWDAEQNKSRYPLDEAWGMKSWQKETPAYRETVVKQVVQRSYRRLHPPESRD